MEQNFEKVRASFIKSEHKYDNYANKHDFTLTERLTHIAKMKHHYCCKLYQLSKLYDIPLEDVVDRLDKLREAYY